MSHRGAHAGTSEMPDATAETSTARTHPPGPSKPGIPHCSSGNVPRSCADQSLHHSSSTPKKTRPTGDREREENSRLLTGPSRTGNRHLPGREIMRMHPACPGSRARARQGVNLRHGRHRGWPIRSGCNVQQARGAILRTTDGPTAAKCPRVSTGR